VFWTGSPWELRRKQAALIAGLLAFGALRAPSPRWDLRLLSLGDFRVGARLRSSSFRDHRETARAGVRLLHYADGPDATISVVEGSGGRALKINGKTDASTGTDMPTQILLGQLPLLLRPDAKEVLVVGLGAGVTAGSVLKHPVERLDVVELSRGVASAARFFAEANGGALADSRLRLSLEDARTFLAASQRRYDAIVSEPSNPWVAGVGNLFSADFYRDARRRLKPGGVMVQWFHLYETDDETFRLILRTFASAFGQVTLWVVAGTDVLLVGSEAPVACDLPRMERMFASGPVAADLARAGMTKLPTLLSLQTAGDASVRELAGDGPLNTDLVPRLEYMAPKAFARGGRSRRVYERDDRLDSRRREGLLAASYLKGRGRALRADELVEILLYRRGSGEESVLEGVREELLRRYPREHSALRRKLAAFGG